MTRHNGLTQGSGSSLFILIPFPQNWRAVLPSGATPGPPAYSDIQSAQLEGGQTRPVYLLPVVLETHQGLCGCSVSRQGDPHRAKPKCCCCFCSASAGRKKQENIPPTCERSGLILRANKTSKEITCLGVLGVKTHTRVQVYVVTSSLFITASYAHWNPPAERSAVDVPTMSPSSQSNVFYSEEQFPRGCFSSFAASQISDWVCLGWRRGAEWEGRQSISK